MASTLGKINPIFYRGYVYDEETEVYCLNIRYYNSNIGRFISPDTAETVKASIETLVHKNLYAYCNNNAVIRKDETGRFWDTIFDVISLGASIVEVIATPGDPWAWAGLVGDVVDLIPGVTGVGEITRGMKTAGKVMELGDDVVDAAKLLKKADDLPEHIKTATGTYEIIFKSGYNYVGKGGYNRAITSALTHADDYADPVVALRWVEAPDARKAFEWEYLLQQQRGVKHWDPDAKTYNIIFSPGRKYAE